MKASGHTAVMADKRARLSDGEPWQKLELFPTPPWATRALPEFVLRSLGIELRGKLVWDPCAGLGHMSAVLGEYTDRLFASDVMLYQGAAEEISEWDFLQGDPFDGEFDWIIANPPFSAATQMARIALDVAREGVAFFCRLQWLETAERYALFTQHPWTLFAPFAERVALCEGGWDSAGKSATSYAWFVWLKGGLFAHEHRPNVLLIPPGRKQALTRAGDARLAALHVPGFVPPSTLKKRGRELALL